MDMFLAFILGLLIGALLLWYFFDSKQQAKIDEVTASWEGKVKHYEAEIKRADQAHEETKNSLREMDAANKKCAARVAELKARLDDAHAVTERVSHSDADKERALHGLQDQQDDQAKDLAEARSRIKELEARLRAREQAPSPISTPDTALGFVGGSGSSTPPAPLAPKERRLKALDAKIKQLPAGSSARRRLEAERRQLLGAEAGADNVLAEDARKFTGGAGGGGTAAGGDDQSDGLTQIFVGPDGDPDDLKIIKGIGPVLEKKLHKLGIKTFAQVAALTPADIEKIDEVLDFKGRIEREGWVEQAKTLS